MAFDFEMVDEVSVTVEVPDITVEYPVIPREPSAVVVIDGVFTDLNDFHVGEEPPSDNTKLWIYTGDL